MPRGGSCSAHRSRPATQQEADSAALSAAAWESGQGWSWQGWGRGLALTDWQGFTAQSRMPQ